MAQQFVTVVFLGETNVIAKTYGPYYIDDANRIQELAQEIGAYAQVLELQDFPEVFKPDRSH